MFDWMRDHRQLFLYVAIFGCAIAVIVFQDDVRDVVRKAPPPDCREVEGAICNDDLDRIRDRIRERLEGVVDGGGTQQGSSGLPTGQGGGSDPSPGGPDGGGNPGGNPQPTPQPQPTPTPTPNPPGGGSDPTPTGQPGLLDDLLQGNPLVQECKLNALGAQVCNYGP